VRETGGEEDLSRRRFPRSGRWGENPFPKDHEVIVLEKKKVNQENCSLDLYPLSGGSLKLRREKIRSSGK